MKIESRLWSDNQNNQPPSHWEFRELAQLVFVFGELKLLLEGRILSQIQADYPNASLVGCSTAGEIFGARVFDGTLSTASIYFEYTQVRVNSVPIRSADRCFEAGGELVLGFGQDAPTHLFVLSSGLNINGSELVRGMRHHLPKETTVSGGLAGDGGMFEKTVVLRGQDFFENQVIGIGFWGERLHVGCGSLGGWDPFGPERLITRSEGNVLYELDDQPALDLYKTYLGEHAQGLPATGLLFPLSFRVDSMQEPVVRTILAVDEDKGSMTFAGDIPQGVFARLMRTNFERLIDGATGAAMASQSGGSSNNTPDLAILVSCVGRKLILKQRVEEEVEAVRDVLGERTVLVGFYSYGELSPFAPQGPCELHNQTMTVTTFKEK